MRKKNKSQNKPWEKFLKKLNSHRLHLHLIPHKKMLQWATQRCLFLVESVVADFYKIGSKNMKKAVKERQKNQILKRMLHNKIKLLMMKE